AFFNGATVRAPTSKVNAGSFPRTSVNFPWFPKTRPRFYAHTCPSSANCATIFRAMAYRIPQSNKSYSPDPLMAAEKLTAHAVILAGGRGTRFWPRSRTRTPKQLLNIVGSKTMLQQTAERLEPLFPAGRLWVVTNREQAASVRRQLPRIAAGNILAE